MQRSRAPEAARERRCSRGSVRVMRYGQLELNRVDLSGWPTEPQSRLKGCQPHSSQLFRLGLQSAACRPRQLRWVHAAARWRQLIVFGRAS